MNKLAIRLLCLFIVIFISVFQVNAQGDLRRPGGKTPQPKATLTVNGSSNSVDLDFSGVGETERITIKTNQGSPKTTDVPTWISVEKISSTVMSIYCQPNNSRYSREDYFYVCAGNLKVKVNVTQRAGLPNITKCEFGNALSNGNWISFPGDKMFANSIRYLTPVLTYNGLGSSISKTLFVRMYNSDGKYFSNASSPNGYTYKEVVTFYPGENTLRLKGWGNENQSVYSTGIARCEIYCDGERIYTGSVELFKNFNESTYLYIDNKTSVSNNISKDGQTISYNISTDADSWQITGIPSFCTVTKRDQKTLTLKFDRNNGPERTSKIAIETRNQKAYINIKQGAGEQLEIKRVWTDYNIYENGKKGMKIHVEFASHGIKGNELNVCAFFYYKNGESLKGYSTSPYKTPDNQTTVQRRTNVQYNHSVWEDFSLFIPYSQLPSGHIALYYEIEIKNLTTNQWSKSSDKQYFK